MRTRSIVTAAALTLVTVLGGAGAAVADPGPDANAEATVSNSPGVLSGNSLQVPVDLGLNLCGNSVDVIGLLNPALGNQCRND
ncbi:chaplin [Streptomyces sp. NPDC004732]|uniref:chaplin n=1 Tax=Streptomyces sp. NPDC004732 TaxID=3154290 RepID=UPI0033A5ED71